MSTAALVRDASTIELEDPLDLHTHLRVWGRDGLFGRFLVWLATLLAFTLPLRLLNWMRGGLLPLVLPYTAALFSAYVVMPNVPAIDTPEQLRRYLAEIRKVNKWRSRPLMTFKVGSKLTPAMIAAFKAAGAIAGKIYPDGVTTGSEGGVRDFRSLWPLFAEMERLNLVLCIHGEMPGVFVMEREIAFLEILAEILRAFPRLRIVLEHITTEQSVAFVREHASQGALLSASITAHHLYYTLDDLIGQRLEVHRGCQPVYKRPEDRAAIIAAALSGERWFFFGSDTAPHRLSDKECAHAACGVFSAPIALEAVTMVFDKMGGAVTALKAFLCTNGRDFYGLTDLPGNVVKLRRRSRKFDGRSVVRRTGVQPFLAEQTIDWEVEQGIPLAA